NLFFSPYSISTALAMTSAGARGDTAREMASALHFTLPDKRLHPAFAALMKQINGPGKDRGYQLRTANALWEQQDYRFLPDFLAVLRDNYGAGLREVDFVRSPDASRQTINDWVEQQTAGKIKDLLPPDMVTPDTRLILTNAIYFKGSWASAFTK